MPNNMILLETIALTQSAASVTFDNLPTSGYTDLKIVVSARSDRNAFVGSYLSVGFNSSTSGYTYKVIEGIPGISTGSGDQTSYSFTAGILVGGLSQANSTASTFGSQDIYIPNYTSSTNKSVSAEGVQETNATSSVLIISAGLWSNTSAITSINLQPFVGGTYFNFLAGSTFSLYGIAAFGTTPVLAPKATGGNIVANDGTYWYHAFTSSGNFVPQVGLTADVLMVSGGGGGSNSGGVGAGGGGGALFYSTANVFTSGTNVPITVGAGGPRDNTSSGPGTAGTLSQFNSTSVSVSNGATGGGGIGGNGGASRSVISGTTTNYTGGSGSGSEPNRSGGGGAGAGANGGNASSGSFGGAGGNGLNTYSSWATATFTGASGYYGGGGGGGFEFNGSASQSSGGLGGGGRGGAGTSFPAYNADNGTASTGGGGGGCGGRSGVVGGTSGNGGSGIVIIRYPIN